MPSRGGRLGVDMFRKSFLLASIAGLLAGCAFQGGSSVPTPYPPDDLPTVIYLTAQSIHATSAIQTAAAITPRSLQPLLLRPSCRLQLHGHIHSSAGHVLRRNPNHFAGSMSKVISPMEVRMSVAAERISRCISLCTQKAAICWTIS